MKQPEAKFKGALIDGFETVFGKHAPDAFCSYVKTTKKGFPDLFFTALGGSCLIEAKVGDNRLEKSQEITLPRLVKGGCRVWLLASNHAAKGDRVVTASKLCWDTTSLWWTPGIYYRGWKCFADRAVWQQLLLPETR
jgi:hypothetical protein